MTGQGTSTFLHQCVLFLVGFCDPAGVACPGVRVAPSERAEQRQPQSFNRRVVYHVERKDGRAATSLYYWEIRRGKDILLRVLLSWFLCDDSWPDSLCQAARPRGLAVVVVFRPATCGLHEVQCRGLLVLQAVSREGETSACALTLSASLQGQPWCCHACLTFLSPE